MKNKEELLQKAYDTGSAYYLKYGGCTQCVLAAVKETIGYVTDDLIKASHPLCGGCSLLGKGICGALSGGLLAIGSKFGRDLEHPDEEMDKLSFKLGKQLIELFQAEFGSFTCDDFQKQAHERTYNMWNHEELELLKSDKFIKHCAHISGKVAQWCVELMV